MTPAAWWWAWGAGAAAAIVLQALRWRPFYTRTPLLTLHVERLRLVPGGRKAPQAAGSSRSEAYLKFRPRDHLRALDCVTLPVEHDDR